MSSVITTDPRDLRRMAKSRQGIGGEIFQRMSIISQDVENVEIFVLNEVGKGQSLITDQDTTLGALADKLEAGSNVTFEILNVGGNEKLRISSIGGGGGGGLIETAATIASGNTGTVDLVSTATFRSALWDIIVEDNVDTLETSEKVAALFQGGGASSFSESNIIGDFTAYLVNVDLSAGSMRLRVTNNGLNSIDVRATRRSVKT